MKQHEKFLELSVGKGFDNGIEIIGSVHGFLRHKWKKAVI